MPHDRHRSLAAAALGWNASVLQGLADETIKDLLELNWAAAFAGAEREHSDLVLAVRPSVPPTDGPAPGSGVVATQLDPETARELTRQVCHGKTNRLSRDDPLPWEVIDQVAAALRKPANAPQGFELLAAPARPTEAGAHGD